MKHGHSEELNASDSIWIKQPGPQRSRTISISKPCIVKIKVLGIGAFARVELVTKNGEEFALKSGQVRHEYDIMKTLNHPNIVRCNEFINMGNMGGLLLDYVHGGELFAMIAFHYDRMLPSWVKTIIHEITSAIHYLHSSQGIAHRDLKLENILLLSKIEPHSNPPKYPFTIKICDFGLATFDALSNEHCGSKEYAAPELILQQEYTPKQVDIWAIGVIWYACCCGQLPFGNPETLAKQVMRQRKKIEFLIAEINYSFIDPSPLLTQHDQHGIEHLMRHRDKRWNIEILTEYLENHEK